MTMSTLHCTTPCETFRSQFVAVREHFALFHALACSHRMRLLVIAALCVTASVMAQQTGEETGVQSSQVPGFSEATGRCAFGLVCLPPILLPLSYRCHVLTFAAARHCPYWFLTAFLTLLHSAGSSL